jgi:glycosyltransferase involved in cell wall biosynthesis
MRLGVVCLWGANAYYRAIDPLKAMERRGHEVLWPTDWEANPSVPRLAECDVVHVYRRADDEIRPLLSKLVRSGTPFTYDNDDDFTAIPKQSPDYKKMGGFRGQRYFAATVKVAQLASSVTTTTDALAEKYRRAGVQDVEVIGNYLPVGVKRRRNRHDGIVIGWVAAGEHRADAAQIKIADPLRQLLEQHDNLHVECIGVDLGLTDRYRHTPFVDFQQLPRRIGAWDIGIAPLSDTPMNRSRSDIKLKEYASCGVPWLASAVGPYAGLGEDEGGWLVRDDGWFEALDQLVRRRRERKRLGRNAKRWAKHQTIDSVADQWEAVFAAAIQRGPGSRQRTDRIR